MNRNDRMTGILLALQSGRKTATQLAVRFEVSRRTILRDIDALSQIGVPIVAVSGVGGGYEVSQGYWLPPVQFTAEETSLLLLALKSLGPGEGSPFGLARLSVEEKLRGVLPELVLKGAEQEVSGIEVTTPLRPERLGHLSELRRAVVAGTWVRIVYQSVRRVAQHDLLPRRLYVDRDRWYCVGFSLVAGEERNFRVDRILEIVAIPPPAGVDEMSLRTGIKSNGPRSSSSSGSLISRFEPWRIIPTLRGTSSKTRLAAGSGSKPRPPSSIISPANSSRSALMRPSSNPTSCETKSSRSPRARFASMPR